MHHLARSYLLTFRYVNPLSDEIMSTFIIMGVLGYCLVFFYIVLF